MSIVLPTEKVPVTEVNPKFLILFGKPKSGKTSILTGLDKCLIIDLENGTDYYSAYSVKVRNLDELAEVREALLANPNLYNYVALDTGSALEDMVMPLAIALYQSTPMGKSYKGKDLRELPQGAGYHYIRLAYKQVIDGFRKVCKHFILTGHLKDKYIEKDGNEMVTMELDLSGKLKSIISADSDAIGYVYRKGKNGNETWINFVANESVVCGARPNHLKNKEILIAKSDENGNMTFHWDQVYLK